MKRWRAIQCSPTTPSDAGQTIWLNFSESGFTQTSWWRKTGTRQRLEQPGLTQKWGERKLSMEGQAVVTNAYIASVIFSCSVYWCAYSVAFLGGAHFTDQALNLLSTEGWVCHGYWCPYMRSGYGISSVSLTVNRCGHEFPQLVFLNELQSWIKRRLRKSAWNLECRPALTGLCQVRKTVAGRFTLALNRRQVEGEYDEVLEETLGVDENQLVSLFRRTFVSGPMDKFWRDPSPGSAIEEALLIGDKL